jgi:ATP-dependent DNA helicase RecQ
MQAEIIQTVLNKKDSVVLMPTGGGKSICYQIPAMMFEGVAIVVSPLISLMKDQVESLKANGVSAAFLNSSLSFSQQSKVEDMVFHGQIKLLYVSPEKLLTESFYRFMKQIKTSLFAIDEAHCISAWGHDFRPEYTKLDFVKRQFPGIPIIALTATADKLTRKDIAVQLSLKDPQIFIASFDRPNLSLTVLPGRDKFNIILRFIRKRQGTSGIIYCLSRKSTENLAAKLKNAGINSAHYHAGLNPNERSKVQEKFINDNISVMCATIAFGMGIDKSNVRWVIHFNLPKNIESYYQEIGRAGRDGLKSDTILFYSIADVITLRSFLNEDNSRKEIELAKLKRMQEYGEALICRRKILLNYFNENLEKNCENCDVCKNPPQQFNGTVIVQKALSAVFRLKEKVGTNMLIDVLRGSSRREIMDKGYYKIKTYGIGRDISFADWQIFILQMLNLGLIEIAYDEGHVLKLTTASKAVLFNNKKVELVQLNTIKEKAIERKKKAKPVLKRERIRDELFEILRQLRKEIAIRQKVPPYIVFTDASLEEMAAEKPTTNDEMLMISGVGERKLKLYGELFVNEIIKFIKLNSEQGMKIKGSTYILTHELYKKGHSIEEIAQKRGLNSATIFSHLAYLYEKGAKIDILKFLSNEELQKIINAVNKTGVTDKLKDLYEYLNEEIEYFKIRLALAYYRVHDRD